MVPSFTVANLELLIVSSDYSTLKTFTRAWRESGTRLDSTPSLACATDVVASRAVHGIVVDAAIKGACEFIRKITESQGKAAPVIVACAGNPWEEREALAAGANFVVQKPFSTSRVFDLLTLSRRIPAPQRRRFLRHKLVTPVTIFSEGLQSRALTADLSERGMSICSAQMFPLDTTCQFAFDMRSSTAVIGQGRIMWTKDDGFAGIRFDSVRCSNSLPFPEWLDRHGVMLQAASSR